MSIHFKFSNVSEGLKSVPRVVGTLLGLLDSVTVERKDECFIELLFFRNNHVSKILLQGEGGM
jgi:hypothetical protein